MERLQARLFKLHDTVRYRTAVPIAQVYVRMIIFLRIKISSLTYLAKVPIELSSILLLSVSISDMHIALKAFIFFIFSLNS